MVNQHHLKGKFSSLSSRGRGYSVLTFHPRAVPTGKCCYQFLCIQLFKSQPSWNDCERWQLTCCEMKWAVCSDHLPAFCCEMFSPGLLHRFSTSSTVFWRFWQSQSNIFPRWKSKVASVTLSRCQVTLSCCFLPPLYFFWEAWASEVPKCVVRLDLSFTCFVSFYCLLQAVHFCGVKDTRMTSSTVRKQRGEVN